MEHALKLDTTHVGFKPVVDAAIAEMETIECTNVRAMFNVTDNVDGYTLLNWTNQPSYSIGELKQWVAQHA